MATNMQRVLKIIDHCVIELYQLALHDSVSLPRRLVSCYRFRGPKNLAAKYTAPQPTNTTGN
jgi:hypothetical protein